MKGCIRAICIRAIFPQLYYSFKQAYLCLTNAKICRSLEIALAYVRRARRKCCNTSLGLLHFVLVQLSTSGLQLKLFEDLGGFDDLVMHLVRATTGTRTATPGRSCATRASATRAASRSSSPSPGGPSRGASSRRIIRSISTTSASSPTRGRRKEGS